MAKAMGWGPAGRTLLHRWSFRDGALPAGVSFARAATSYVVDRNGRWASIGSGAAPFSYSHDGSRFRGYVPFSERTNLLAADTHNDFSSASWTKTGFNVTSAQRAGPFGTTTMWEIEDTSSGADWMYQAVSISADTKIRVFSCHVAAGTVSQVRMWVNQFGGSGSQGLANFNLSTGAITTTLGSSDLMNIDAMGNGVYRISVGVVNANDTVAAVALQAGSGDSATGTFFAEWAQYEESPQSAGAAYPSPPLAGGATRPSDNATATLAVTLPATFLVYADCNHIPGGLSYAYSLTDGTLNFNLVNIQSLDRPTNNSVGYHVMAGGANQGGENTAGLMNGAFPRVAWGVRCGTNDFSCDGKGVAGTTDNSGTLPTGLDEHAFGFLDILDNGWFEQGLLSVDVYSGLVSRAEVQRLIYIG